MSATTQTRPFLTAEWRYLLMLNYEIDPIVLRPLVPPGTELDLWHDRALFSLVGFRFLRTRVRGIPIPLHQDFDEINLRFYIRRWDGATWKRAVAFVREIVPRPAIAWIARKVYGEPYVALPMRHELDMGQAQSGGFGQVRYEWRHRREWCGLHAETTGAPGEILPGSEEEFITEHYWGYTTQRNGGCLEYQVAHPRWRVWSTQTAGLTGAAADFYPAVFAEPLGDAPRSAFVAEGSAIVVHQGRPIEVGSPWLPGAPP